MPAPGAGRNAVTTGQRASTITELMGRGEIGALRGRLGQLSFNELIQITRSSAPDARTSEAEALRGLARARAEQLMSQAVSAASTPQLLRASAEAARQPEGGDRSVDYLRRAIDAELARRPMPAGDRVQEGPSIGVDRGDGRPPTADERWYMEGARGRSPSDQRLDGLRRAGPFAIMGALGATLGHPGDAAAMQRALDMGEVGDRGFDRASGVTPPVEHH